MGKREYTLEEQNYIVKLKNENDVCCYCGKKLSRRERTLEHILPINRGGETVPENLAVCCEKCNKEKSDMTLQEYIEYKDRKKKFVSDIQLKIDQEELKKERYVQLLEEITKNYDMICYLKHIIKIYTKKVTMLKDLKSISCNKIEELQREKDLMENIFELETTKERIGKLNNADIELDFNYKLKQDNEDLLRDPIIKSIIINSTINNSIINNSIINNSYVSNSNIEDSQIG
ncbi:HNH endonuclease (plasmid) [Clostridium perfringens]|uniref:HNH endonuclease n=1 Tax=Clostridium perfringens TaxID=1502 RepID=UPI001CAD52C9|nr:HNH endonuclease [Clostridium perfringens]UBL00788.1 HNH endonuclease [Clostridium perfringens]HBI7094978.1 HNH endonuclease [Clostridium perfringens]